MLTNRWLPGGFPGRPRFPFFRSGKQWNPADRETADYVARAGCEGSTRNSNGISWTTSPVNDVTNAQGIIWVDAVGGFLAILSDTIRVGQALPHNQIELPLVGDISRQHTVIQRSGEDYLLTPLGPTTVDGRTVGGLTRLSDGDEIGMNESVRLRFRKPHPLSNSARLEVLSHHRTMPPVDGILLIGQNLLLGPDPNCHIVCRDWNQTLALQSQSVSQSEGKHAGFRFQSGEPVQLNQASESRNGCIEWGERLTGENFALVLERL